MSVIIDGSNGFTFPNTSTLNNGAFSGGVTAPSITFTGSNQAALNDYETGTWTPTLTGASSVSLTNNGSQTYIKVGKFVTLFYDFTVASNSVAAQASLGGFPFTTGANPQYFGGGFNNFAGGLVGGTNYSFNWLINSNTTTAGANYSGAGSAQVTPANISALRLIGQLTYISAS